MKKLILLLLLLLNINYLAYSQELPTIPSSGFSFPLGSKFTIKLISTDSSIYDYSIIEFESFQEIIDSRKIDNLFPKEGPENTISFYFCLGTYGETDEEKEKNMRIHLYMKNYTTKAFDYISEILRDEDGEYENTSNIGSYPGAIGNEIWPYMIYFIGLRDFQEM